jgi:hypothetical protein
MQIYSILIFGLAGLFLATFIVSFQQVGATGCPTAFVGEHIKNAKTALQNGNTEEVLNQLQLAEDAMKVVPAE